MQSATHWLHEEVLHRSWPQQSNEHRQDMLLAPQRLLGACAVAGPDGPMAAPAARTARMAATRLILPMLIPSMTHAKPCADAAHKDKPPHLGLPANRLTDNARPANRADLAATR
jgi:hypothetical protein